MNKELEKMIERINKKYNFRVDIHPETVCIYSKCGGYYAYKNSIGRIVLKHRNYRKDTNKFHIQRDFANYEQLFDHIDKHDYFILTGRYINKITNKNTNYIPHQMKVINNNI